MVDQTRKVVIAIAASAIQSFSLGARVARLTLAQNQRPDKQSSAAGQTKPDLTGSKVRGLILRTRNDHQLALRASALRPDRNCDSICHCSFAVASLIQNSVYDCELALLDRNRDRILFIVGFRLTQNLPLLAATVGCMHR